MRTGSGTLSPWENRILVRDLLNAGKKEKKDRNWNGKISISSIYQISE